MIIDMPTVSMGNSGKILPADKVSYDNTTSGLEADNVQDAVDEVSAELDDVEASLNEYIEFDQATMWEDRNGFTTTVTGFRKGNTVILSGTTNISGKGRYPNTSDLADNGRNTGCVGYITDERFIPSMINISFQQISDGGALQGLYMHYINGADNESTLIGAVLEISANSTTALVPNYRSGYTLRWNVTFTIV